MFFSGYDVDPPLKKDVFTMETQFFQQIPNTQKMQVCGVGGIVMGAGGEGGKGEGAQVSPHEATNVYPGLFLFCGTRSIRSTVTELP